MKHRFTAVIYSAGATYGRCAILTSEVRVSRARRVFRFGHSAVGVGSNMAARRFLSESDLGDIVRVLLLRLPAQKQLQARKYARRIKPDFR